MLKLIPAVKNMQIYSNFLSNRSVCYDAATLDSRLAAALQRLPFDPQGAKLDIRVTGTSGESYTLSVKENAITILAPGPAGAFYAIQTLRQLFTHDRIPCLTIQDAPDFPYRGFYHDVTRGRIPTLKTLKELVDRMAYFKLNSLQLYVEHVFPFAETQDLIPHTGCLTPEELLELQAYCRENFIDFIPSLATFGHMYEILNQPRYRHLQVLSDHTPSPNFWKERMLHHTIDPSQDESFRLVTSLIGQYLPLFSSDHFNICCDETFDLEHSRHLGDPGVLYGQFVQKLIRYVTEQGKQTMMWADILVKHPELIEALPEDTCFLAWSYGAEPDRNRLDPVAASGRKMIVCPGCSNWNWLCENIEISEKNICRMAEYGYHHGALGVLNTSWGDWGNPCSLDLSMYGMVLGAEKSWSVKTEPDNSFYSNVNYLLYKNENGMHLLIALCRMHTSVSWTAFCQRYFDLQSQGTTEQPPVTREALGSVQADYLSLKTRLGSPWTQDTYRQEMLCCAEGLCVMAELSAKSAGIPVRRLTDTEAWLARYSQNWLAGNKPSELYQIQNMFRFMDAQ